jgi:hypothetical protein
MANFDLSRLRTLPPAPPPDPRVARAEKIANDTRVESELNRFIVSKQDAMFNNPDAFYRTRGEDAIHAAPVARKNLEQLRDNLLDGLANDYQRQRLGAALEAQMQLTRRQMARHVSEQSLVWQRGVAQDRIALLTREAALHHNDDDLIDGIGAGAANAARAHARVGGGPIDTDRENAAAATAQSRIFSAAIQARLDKGLTSGAAALFDRTRDQLDPAHAASLETQIQAAQQPSEPSENPSELAPISPDIEQGAGGSVGDVGMPADMQGASNPDGNAQSESAEGAEILSDAAPEPVLPGRQYAQAGGGRPPNRGTRGSGGESAEVNARIRAASFQSHIEAIRKLESNNRELSYVAPQGWVPTERDVARIHEELLRARERNRGELLPNRNTLEPGPYAGESIRARSSKRDFTAQERAEINRIGSQTGCHTCGTREPGTPLGNFVLDHQRASRLNLEGSAQRLFPQCLSCSARQGGEVTREVNKGDEQ